MNTRIGILLTFFCDLIIIVLIGGCSGTPFPQIETIPASSKLPIDGVWRAANGPLVYKVEGGRMYLYCGYYDMANVGPGSIFMKDIQQTNDPKKYNAVCVTADTVATISDGGGPRTNFIDFTPCGIEIIGDSLLRIQSPSNYGGGIKSAFAETIAVFFNGQQLIIT